MVWARSGVGKVWPLTIWLLPWLQDSDGDKSDDLVVDVSNEVWAGPAEGGSWLGMVWDCSSPGWDLFCLF